MRSTGSAMSSHASQSTTAVHESQTRLDSSLAFLKPFLVPDLVRIGTAADGGYVVPKAALDEVDALISFGVGSDWTVEQAVHLLHPDIPIHSYDYTIGAPVFRELRRQALRRLLGEIPRLLTGTSSFAQVRERHAIHRERRGLYSNYLSFFQNNRVHYRERVYNRRERRGYVCVDDAFARLATRRKVFLKMDIEGGEYRVIRNVLRFSDRLILLVVEFHETDPYRSVFVERVREICSNFSIAHLHANNYSGSAADGLPETLEITFVKKSFIGSDARRARLPIRGLDFPNDPTQPDVALCWE